MFYFFLISFQTYQGVIIVKIVYIVKVLVHRIQIQTKFMSIWLQQKCNNQLIINVYLYFLTVLNNNLPYSLNNNIHTILINYYFLHILMYLVLSDTEYTYQNNKNIWGSFFKNTDHDFMLFWHYKDILAWPAKKIVRRV